MHGKLTLHGSWNRCDFCEVSLVHLANQERAPHPELLWERNTGEDQEEEATTIAAAIEICRDAALVEFF